MRRGLGYDRLVPELKVEQMLFISSGLGNVARKRYAIGRVAAIFAAVIVAAGCATQSAASRSNATAASAPNASTAPSGETPVTRASATEDSLSAVKAEVDRLTVELDKLSIELDAAAKSKDVKLAALAARLDALSARVESIQKGESDISRLNAMVDQLQRELQRMQSAPPVSAAPALPTAPTRDSRYWPQGYYPGDPLPPRTVYLSFDDGPSDFTVQILDILKEEGVHATFFMNSYDKDNPFHADTGKNLLFRYAVALRRMVDEGHAIGNHTYSTPRHGRSLPVSDSLPTRHASASTGGGARR